MIQLIEIRISMFPNQLDEVYLLNHIRVHFERYTAGSFYLGQVCMTSRMRLMSFRLNGRNYHDFPHRDPARLGEDWIRLGRVSHGDYFLDVDPGLQRCR